MEHELEMEHDSMPDDELLVDIKQTTKKSRTNFQSMINRKNLSGEEMDELFNGL